ncbi:hypothetical protein DSECCO2_654800 [anaerobic digester metagenome]
MSSLQESVKKASYLAALFLKFFSILMVIAICIQFFQVALSLSSVNGQTLTQWGRLPVSQSVGFQGTNGEMLAQSISDALSQSLLLAMLLLATVLFNDAAKHYTPFSEKQSTRLKIISLLTLALGILPPPIKMLLTLMLSPDSNASAEFQFALPVLTIIFYSLSVVFDYGRMLQKQSDETL